MAGAMAALGRVPTWLRERFTEQDDEAATTALERLEDAPDSPSRMTALAEVVDRLATDDEFRTGLEALVTEVEGAGVDVGSVVQSAWGNQNVQMTGIANSDIRANFGRSPKQG